MKKMFRRVGKYFWNILISVDQFGNTIMGGDPDETISSRAGKRRHKNIFAKSLCWILDKLDKKHCEDSIEEDEGSNGT